MDDEIQRLVTRAMAENPAARLANESFACGTVGAMAISELDDVQVLARMSTEEALKQASAYRTIIAYAVRGAILCERHAAARMASAA